MKGVLWILLLSLPVVLGSLGGSLYVGAFGVCFGCVFLVLGVFFFVCFFLWLVGGVCGATQCEGILASRDPRV